MEYLYDIDDRVSLIINCVHKDILYPKGTKGIIRGIMNISEDYGAYYWIEVKGVQIVCNECVLAPVGILKPKLKWSKVGF